MMKWAGEPPYLEFVMRQAKRGLTLIECAVVLGILLLLVALMLPAVRTAREPARRNQCLNNLKQIGLALHNYHDAHGSFPPAYTVDEEGNRLHSWRTLILPFVEEQALYDSIDLTKPWDDPANAEALATTLPNFQCPSWEVPEGHTTYLAVVGEGFAFSGPKGTKLEEIADGASDTLLVIDATTEAAVHWMSPEDADESLVQSYVDGVKTNHPGVFLAAFADGHCTAIDVETPPEVRRTMLTIAGGEEVDD